MTSFKPQLPKRQRLNHPPPDKHGLLSTLVKNSSATMRATPALRMQATRILRSGAGPDPKNGVYVNHHLCIRLAANKQRTKADPSFPTDTWADGATWDRRHRRASPHMLFRPTDKSLSRVPFIMPSSTHSEGRDIRFYTG